MAIVINGSGTVTGLSVGGLPDGTVDAGTLASNAVTEAKIASSAVVTAKLNDDAVTNAKMANDAITEHELAGSAVVTAAINDDAITAAKLASGVGGKILQVVTGELTSHVQMATTSWQNTGLTANITPSATSSKILITVSFGKAQTTQSNGDHTYSMRLLRQVGGTNYDSDLNGVADGSRSRALFSQGGHSYNASHSMGGFSITGVDSPNTTSEITYYAQAWPQSGSYPLILNGVSNNTNDANTYHSRTKAILTMMEIAG
jgi:hypothetical protein